MNSPWAAGRLLYGVMVAAAVIMAVTAASPSPRGARAAQVTIDFRTTFQRMDGFGAAERVFDDPHVFNNFDPTTGRAATTMTRAQQDAVMDLLYRDLRLTRVRPASPEGGGDHSIEPQNDNDDPNVLAHDRFNFNWKNLDAHIEYLRRARSRGVNVYFLSPASRERWLTGNSPADAAEYSEWLFAMVLRSRELGLPMPYLSIANEPSYTRNPLSGEFLRDVIKILGPRLRAAGIATVFVIPDDIRSSDSAQKAEAILSDPDARRYVGALATHLYDEPVPNLDRMTALSAKYRLPLWVTEYSLKLAGSAGMGSDPIDLVRLVHVLISDHGVSAIDYQWGAFGQWELGTQLVVLNSQANEPHAYTGYTLPKEFYFLGQYSRFITPGALLVAVKSSDPQVKVTAFLQGPHVTVVALNDSGETRMARFDFTAPERLKLQVTRTSQTESWVRLPAVVTRHRGLSYALPALSVTTFTGTLASPLAPRLSATDSGVLQADMSASAQCRSSGTPLQRPSLGAWLGKGVNCAL